MPPHRHPRPQILVNKDGSLTVQYMPTQSGQHELSFVYNELPVEGSPLTFNIDAVANGHYVSAYGPGLVQGSSGERQHFFVTGGGDSDNIDVTVDGPGPAEIIQKEEEEKGLLKVIYIPLTPGEFNVGILFKKKHILGSPFAVKVAGAGRKKSRLSVVATSDYVLGGNDVELTNLQGVIKTPSGETEYCLLKKMPSGKLGITSFQPKKKGTYIIEVIQDGAKFPGSPFQIHVGDNELCNPSRAKTTGATREGFANKWNEININVSEAGFGSLSFATEGPYRVDLESQNVGIGEYLLRYKPIEPGIYSIIIRYGDDNIAGSPFMVNIGGQPSGYIREVVSKQIQAAETVSAGQSCELNLKIPGCSPLDMEATMTSPSGKSDLCEIRDLPDSLFDIKFTPPETGVHIISLKHKGIHIPGSPLQYSVGKSPAGGTHKVEFGGMGAELGAVGIKNEFNIYTREAGPGVLSVGIDGPSKAKIELVDRGGFVTASYIVTKDGDYSIGVKYNNEHVPKSPVKIQVDPECKEAKQVTVHGLRDRGLEVDKPALFNCNLNGARGELTGFIISPSGNKEELSIQELDNDLHAIRFMPKENGVYYVNLKFNNAHIPGSPYPMLIGKLDADPAMVVAKGDGLESGECGRASKFSVTTASAGCGTLGIIIDGPSRMAINCVEEDDGYEFSYTPTAPGDYMIDIKFCNVSVAGCPYKAVITGKGKASDETEQSVVYIDTVEKKAGAGKSKQFQGDASKVSLQGAGLKKSFIGRPATFNVDVKDAGQGFLSVGMVSPNGNPVTELSYKKQRPGLYVVTYKADEKGDYFLSIRWGANEVPGSPCTVNVS